MLAMQLATLGPQRDHCLHTAAGMPPTARAERQLWRGLYEPEACRTAAVVPPAVEGGRPAGGQGTRERFPCAIHYTRSGPLPSNC